MTHRAKRFTEPVTKQSRYEQRAAESDRRAHAFHVAYTRPHNIRRCQYCGTNTPKWAATTCLVCGSTFAPGLPPLSDGPAPSDG